MALIPKYNRFKFSDVWNNAQSFYDDYMDSGLALADTDFDEEHCKWLFYLLIGKYANNIIANDDVNQFKYKVYSLIFTYGPEWQRKLQIQKTLREMNEDDLIKESEAINNHANNPSTKPSTINTTELAFVDDQTYAKRNRAKLDAYQFLWSVLHSDITPLFLSKFESLFTKFVSPNCDAVFCAENDEE